MVGVVIYHLHVNSNTSPVLCQAAVTFIVVGFSLSQVPAPISTSSAQGESVGTIVSGAMHQLRLHYEDVLASRFVAFRLFIQFADGTNSTTLSAARLLQLLAHLSISCVADATSPVYFDASCNPMQSVQQLTSSPCGLAVEVHEVSQHTQITLWLKFESYRDGLSVFSFSWSLLVEHDVQLAHEEFINVLYVSVVGNVPPIVLDLYPRAQLFRTGGQYLTVVMDNIEGSSARFLSIGLTTCLELAGSYQRRIDGLFEAVYITQPGNGTDLAWSFYVSFPEGVSRTAVMVRLELYFSLSYATTPLAIHSIQPAVGRAGDQGVLTGYFDGFEPLNPGHHVFIGRRSVRALGIVIRVNDVGTKISFEIPNRALLGAAYQYFIRVVVNAESTKDVVFSYKPDSLILEILVYGASYDADEDIYDVGNCTISRYIASLPSGVPDPRIFEWKVIDSTDITGQNLLTNSSAISTDTKSLLLPPQIFRGKEGKFVISVSCEVDGEGVTSEVVVRKQLKPLIGVTLSRPQARSISIPNVPVRLSAMVTTPRTDCYNHSAKVIYRWIFVDDIQEFSYRNYSEHPMNSSSTPTKLGREYVIPQSRLSWGNLSVTLLAYMEDEPSIFGRATMTMTIFPAPLVPVIGYGASRILHSVSDDLVISAMNSYDPDRAFLGNNTEVQTFEWSCRIIVPPLNTTNFHECDSDLLPGKHLGSFTVNRTSLVNIRDALLSESKEGLFFIKYGVVVAVDNRRSTKTFQVVEVSPDTSEVARLEDLQLLDNRGNTVDWLAVRHFDDLLIAPTGQDTSWSFDVISPVSSTLIFKQPGNLILHPGYFDPTLPSLRQTLPLGVKAGTFLPTQDYEILITLASSKSGVEKGECRILIRTEDRPSLILPELPILNGDLETTFVAIAKVNLDSSYDFSYYFFLVRSDGDEYCLDGCSGTPYVQFRCAEPGNFRIMVRLMDLQGKTLFDEAFYAQEISVSRQSLEVNSMSSAINLAAFNESLRLVHHLGDHGTFELLASSLATRVQDGDVHALSDGDVKVLDLAVDAMHQIAQNSAPTTMSSKSYIRTASRFVSMDAEYFAAQETMYTLFSLVDKAITQVPKTEAFDLQDELLLFYNLSARHVLTMIAGSTVRNRLRQFGSVSGLDARSLLIDMYLLQEEHLTTVLSRDAQCGMVTHLDTNVAKGMAADNINNLVIERHSARRYNRSEPNTFDILESYGKTNEKPNHSAFTLAVLCNPDQAKGIRGEATSFEWCDDVFSKSGMTSSFGTHRIDPNQKRLFTLMETVDYTWLSGIGGDNIQSDTKFLVTTNVTTIKGNQVIPLALPHISRCYSVNTSMSRLGVTSSKGCLSAKGFIVQELGRPFEPKVLLSDLRRNFSAVYVNMSMDGSSTISITSSSPGVFGAIGTDCPINARKPMLIIPYGENTDFLYVVFGGVVIALISMSMTWVITSTAFSAFSTTPATV